MDKTFCTGNGCRDFDKCSRALTKEVEARAIKWWGNDQAPIARFEHPEQLSCYNRPLENKTDKPKQTNPKQ
jgi:hypothetical protein